MKILMTNFTKMVNDSGGVAKVMCSFANEMVKRGHEVSAIYSDENEGDFFFSIDKSVKLYNAKKNIDGSIIKFPLHLKAFREVLRCFNKRKAQMLNRDFDETHLLDNIKRYMEFANPDIIVSYQIEGTIFLLNDIKTEVPVITMSHGSMNDYYDEKERYALENSKVFQVLVPAFERQINKLLPKVNTITIGNAIPEFAETADLLADKDVYKIIFVGRLNKNHKRPHLLLEAFSKIADKYPNWNVELWGKKGGKAYYAELEQFIKMHNLEKRVFLRGTTNNVASKLLQADIFAFPSAYEGFSLALGEGMMVGLPTVGYLNCLSVNEIIKDKETGFLCEDGVDAFADALDKLMSDKQLRCRMGAAARADMKQYTPEKIWDTWENLLMKYHSKNA